MAKEIEQYFTYFWANDKNYCVQDEADQDILRELPPGIQANIYRDFLFKDFLQSFHQHFSFKKLSKSLRAGYGLAGYWNWDDSIYSKFMIDVCQTLEPRYYAQGTNIFEEGEQIDEMIYVLRKDMSKPSTCVSQYAIGYMSQRGQRYFKVRLGPKSVIGGYEMLFNHYSEFTYRALSDVEAYSIRRQTIMPIFGEVETPDFKKQMMLYMLDYYQQIVREPMLEFKLKIESQNSKK